MPDDADNLTNAEREAHRGRFSEAIALLAGVMVGQRRRVRALESDHALLVERVRKLEEQQTW